MHQEIQHTGHGYYIYETIMPEHKLPHEVCPLRRSAGARLDSSCFLTRPGPPRLASVMIGGSTSVQAVSSVESQFPRACLTSALGCGRRGTLNIACGFQGISFGLAGSEGRYGSDGEIGYCFDSRGATRSWHVTHAYDPGSR